MARISEREKQNFIKKLGKGIAQSFFAAVSQLADSINFTVGAEAANVVSVTIQTKTDSGNNTGKRIALRFYLSSDAAGQTPADVTTIAAGASGAVLAATVNGGTVVTTTTGTAIIACTLAAGAATRYLNVILPSGEVKTSSVMTWAA